MDAPTDRKRLGAWYTPDELVALVVDGVVTPEFVRQRTRDGRRLCVLDPACGDGRFLAAVATRVTRFGGEVQLHGVDLDPAAVDRTRAALPDATVECADALTNAWPAARFDLVIGNPPFLSQMSRHTTRGGAGAHGGGAYADAAVEFLAAGSRLVDPDGGRLAFVLPQSLLASRDAGAVRRQIDERASMIWSWWTGRRVFDAQVLTCALAFEFDTHRAGPRSEADNWSHVVTRRNGLPPLPDAVASSGRLGDRSRLNANFRDEYYGLVPAVGDHPEGPPLVTSGLIDPGRCLWGERPVTFARRRWQRPRVDVDRLDTKMRTWAERRLVPKVLVANQTTILEAVCDPDGTWLPAVPVVCVYPSGAHWDDATRVPRAVLQVAAWEIAAVLTSSFAAVWLWHAGAGTGLSARTIRLSPVVLAGLPWPAGDLGAAADALRRGDERGCAAAVDAAYGVHPDDGLGAWWRPVLERIEGRRAAPSR